MRKQKQKVLEYNVIFAKADEGGFYAFVPDLPGCVSQGENFEETQNNIKEAIELYLESEDNELYEVTPEDAHKQFMAPIQINA